MIGAVFVQGLAELVRGNTDMHACAIFLSSERASELEATVSDLEEQLRDQELEASGVISQWETQFAELQKANAELTQSLAETVNHSKELADENDSLASLRVQLTEKEAALAEETKKTSSWKGKVFFVSSWISLHFSLTFHQFSVRFILRTLLRIRSCCQRSRREAI